MRFLASTPLLLCLGCALAGAVTACSGGTGEAEKPEPSSVTSTSTMAAPGSAAPDLAGLVLAFAFKDTGAKSSRLYVANADGSQMTLIDDTPGEVQSPQWSPDGKRIAFRWLRSGDYTDTPMIVIDADGSNRIDLSEASGLKGWSPAWSPDGTRLAVTGTRRSGRAPALFVMNADGTHAVRLTALGQEAQYPSWSPNGQWIAFHFVTDHGGFDIFKIHPDGSDLTRLTNGNGYNEWPLWSPDSQQIAYSKEDGPKPGLWLMNDDGSNPHSITTAGGAPAAWAPGELIAFNCPMNNASGIGICAIRPDGTGLMPLLAGADAGFPAWKPQPDD
jgi:Tol biopolymer transport system component